MNQILQIEQGI